MKTPRNSVKMQMIRMKREIISLADTAKSVSALHKILVQHYGLHGSYRNFFQNIILHFPELHSKFKVKVQYNSVRTQVSLLKEELFALAETSRSIAEIYRLMVKNHELNGTYRSFFHVLLTTYPEIYAKFKIPQKTKRAKL